MRKGFLSIWVAAGVLVLFALVLSQTYADLGKKRTAQPQFKSGEIIVKLKPQKLMSVGMQTHALLNGLGKRYAVSINPFQTDKTLLKIRVNNPVTIGQLIADAESSSQVAYAEPNYLYHTNDLIQDPVQAVVPNDPNFNLNWGLLNTGQKDSKGQDGLAGSDIGATKAWAFGTGSKDIVVAVIDTGVDYNHEDLKDNIFVNTKEIAGNGKDDDGNGFIDDVHGWNFEKKNGDPMDDNRHGTHTSGTIGAHGNNGIGTAGVNWHVSILPIKFLSASGSGSLDDAVEAINYATLMGAKIMSNSWGGGGYSQAMYDAIKAARDKGILFVAAAGNEGNNNDSSAAYPASYELENVVAVAATDNRDQKSSWSNFGQRRVHLAAPGVNVYSTVPTDKGGYDTFSGTSMACPHVAGAAALLWSMNKNMTFADVKTRLLTTVDPVRSLRRKTSAGGRLNISNAVQNIIPERREPPADRWKGMAKAVQSKHPYENGVTQSFEIQHPGAKYLRLHFAKVGTEAGYDLIQVKGATGEVIEELSGEVSDYTTDYVDGDKITVTFTSDSSVDGWGFAIDKYEFID